MVTIHAIGNHLSSEFACIISFVHAACMLLAPTVQFIVLIVPCSPPRAPFSNCKTHVAARYARSPSQTPVISYPVTSPLKPPSSLFSPIHSPAVFSAPPPDRPVPFHYRMHNCRHPRGSPLCPLQDQLRSSFPTLCSPFGSLPLRCQHTTSLSAGPFRSLLLS